jgi:hypothetical protein
MQRIPDSNQCQAGDDAIDDTPAHRAGRTRSRRTNADSEGRVIVLHPP